MFEDTPSWKRDPIITGTILFVLLISPMGAPLLGLITIEACDIPLDGTYQCMVPAPVIAYFMIFLWGPFFIFGPVALLWFAICIGLIIRSAGMFASSVWLAVMGD